MFQQIFNKQIELFDTYRDIERINGTPVPSCSVNKVSYQDLEPYDSEVKKHMTVDLLDDPNSRVVQEWIRWHLWYFVEELSEAILVMPYPWCGGRDHHEEPEYETFFDEIADSLHFLVEMTAVLGVSYVTIDEMWKSSLQTELSLSEVAHPAETIYLAMAKAGALGNCLKAKPWKQTDAPINDQFHPRLVELWDQFILVMRAIGWRREDVQFYYERKSNVNKQRQQNGY